MKYVALLRGINVGGKARVEMPRLKLLFVAAGCTDVVTYINSGNVVFEDARTSEELVAIIEAAIVKEFGFAVPLVIKSARDFKRVCKKIPTAWANDTEQRTDVVFFRDEISPADIKAQLTYRPEIDNVLFIGNSVAWNVTRANVTRSSLTKVIGSKLYPFLTIRNLNTVRKLEALIELKNVTTT